VTYPDSFSNKKYAYSYLQLILCFMISPNGFTYAVSIIPFELLTPVYNYIEHGRNV
jgi:hypothetical protein